MLMLHDAFVLVSKINLYVEWRSVLQLSPGAELEIGSDWD
jgi:hypothetical protein